jgi:ABC-type dipeptide/oligopeptide/nickel transport system permease component
VGRYVLRRALWFLPLTWAAVTLLFVAFHVMPADPVDLMGGSRGVTPQVRANIESRLGLDQPVHVQYGRYMARLAQGDLGESFRSGRSVGSILAQTAPASVRLAFWAVTIQVVLGLAAGVLSAVKRKSWADSLATVSTTLLLAVPVFVLGYLLIYTFSVTPAQRGFPDWARLPAEGIRPDRWLGVIPLGDQWRSLVLPAVTLGAVNAALLARVARGAMLDALLGDYIRTAEALGVPRRRIILHHALRNAMLPVLTLVGLSLADLIGAAVITETIFNWPGIGSTVARAVLDLDAPVVLGLSIVLVVTYLAVNLVVDVGYALLDPRARHQDGD